MLLQPRNKAQNSKIQNNKMESNRAQPKHSLFNKLPLLQQNSLLVALAPERITLSQSKRSLWRDEYTQELTLPCVTNGGDDLTQALDMLENNLKKAPWNSTRVTVVLSNHFVRYMLIPWSDMLLHPKEQQAYLQHLFNETYGDTAANHALRLSPAAPGKERIASALDKTLLEQVRSTVSNAGLPLDSIQPWLMYCFNLYRNQMSDAGGWFASVEHGMAAIIGVANGAWRLVHTLRCGTSWQHELQAALDRFYLSGEARAIPKTLYWCSNDTPHDVLAFNDGWQLVHLETTNNGDKKIKRKNTKLSAPSIQAECIEP